MDPLNLVILTSLMAKQDDDGKIVLTRKFIDGVTQYQKYWPGSITVLLEENKAISDNLDHVSIHTSELPFQIKIVDFETIQEHKEFHDASVVLASTGYRQNHIGKLCKLYGIPCIYVTEYSLRTRIQIINAITKNPILRLRKYLWEVGQESKQRKAIEVSSGVQCNGTPTYEAYQSANSHCLLYFDSRVQESMLPTVDELAKKTSQCLAHTPLRLLFSGRLIKIKGADHLILVAKELKKLGVQFELFICGDGDLRESMQVQILRHDLSDVVKILGVLDFSRELVPTVKENIDLFLCCHRQGDPSCTYLETASCGVPIVGYDNEAFVGFVNHSQAGWPIPMNRPDLVAKKVFELNKNRQAIVDASLKALEFAKLHTFEKTFERRINHLKQHSGQFF